MLIYNEKRKHKVYFKEKCMLRGMCGVRKRWGKKENKELKLKINKEPIHLALIKEKTRNDVSNNIVLCTYDHR